MAHYCPAGTVKLPKWAQTARSPVVCASLKEETGLALLGRTVSSFDGRRAKTWLALRLL